MCNFQTIKDAADVAIATMLSGIQVCPFLSIFPLLQLPFKNNLKVSYEIINILLFLESQICLRTHDCLCNIKCLSQIKWLPVVVFDILPGLLWVLG
jgi:hypothetical protein